MKTVHNHFLTGIVFALTVFLLVQHSAHAIVVSTSSTVYVSAEVGGSTPPPPSPGGGGGSSSGTTGLPTTVNFSGMAYPSSPVIILKDGTIVVSTVADPNANFSASVANLVQGNYAFAVYTTDKTGLHSASFSFPVYITTGATVNIGGIILAPTIDVDKTEVKRGDNEAIFGYSVPNSQINIAVHSDTGHFVQATTAANGAYLYNFDTTPLEYGQHNAQSRALLSDNKVSAQTGLVSFAVSNENKAKPPAGCGTVTGDVNCDGKVNLVDFSIMAYWYKKKTAPPTIVDLNGDGKISLVDFSILAYHWTG